MSTQTCRRWLGLLLIVLASTSRLAHSQVPSPAQAQQMLKDNPALIARIQQMLRTSGLTSEQIRQRLRAQGYSEAMLDAYLPGNGGGLSSSAGRRRLRRHPCVGYC
jgi:hypothetical protein